MATPPSESVASMAPASPCTMPLLDRSCWRWSSLKATRTFNEAIAVLHILTHAIALAGWLLLFRWTMKVPTTVLPAAASGADSTPVALFGGRRGRRLKSGRSPAVSPVMAASIAEKQGLASLHPTTSVQEGATSPRGRWNSQRVKVMGDGNFFSILGWTPLFRRAFSTLSDVVESHHSNMILKKHRLEGPGAEGADLLPCG